MKQVVEHLSPLLAILFVFLPVNVWAQSCPVLENADEAALEQEHLYGGAPSTGPILIRRGYVTQYDAEHRVPRWSAWHVSPEFLDTPKRKGRWSQFRTDPDVGNPVTDDDYLGLLEDLDYARGHIVPYFVSGGDRDHDGKDAEFESNLKVEDIDDACTVFEINYMSNIAPQLQSSFNGAGGLWYALETKIRKKIVGEDRSLHIIGGTVFDTGIPEGVGPDEDIGVPDMFYQILIVDEGAVPFLFVHRHRIGSKGCELDEPLEKCIVKVRDIETVTQLDFFAALTDAEETRLEDSNGRAVWRDLLGE